MFATQETSPYDIAVVSLEEELEGVPVPVPTEHFYEGKGQRSPLLWGKSALDTQTLQIREPVPSANPLATPAGLISQGGTQLA